MEIYKKIQSVKNEIGKVSKDSENPFYKSKYFDINSLLEHLEPLFSKNNLLLIQPIKNGHVQSVLIDIETNEELISEIKLPDITDPQKIGSCITYFRRYSLKSLLGIQEEDDDANKAVTKPDINWLNKFEDDKKTISKDWKRAIATLKEGKDIKYLREKFKISKITADMLTNDFKNE